MKKIALMMLFAFTLTMSLSSCNKKEEAEMQQMQDEAVDLESVLAEDTAAQDSSAQISYANFTMQIPSGWTKEAPTNELRLLQFGFEGDSGNKVTGFFFGKDTDVREGNVARWKSEFVKVENSAESKLVNNTIDFIQLSGTFKKKARPMDPNFTEAPGYVTLAAIVPSSVGHYYFKLNGPKEIVEKQKDNFVKFLESYKTK